MLRRGWSDVSEPWEVAITVTTLQMRKLWLKEVNNLPKVTKLGKWQNQESMPPNSGRHLDLSLELEIS